MNKLQENYSLKKHNSFGIDINAKYFFSFTDEIQLLDFLPTIQKSKLPILILGGGNNILFTKNFDGNIIHPQNKGIEIIDDNSQTILVKVSAGEIWDDFVAWAVNRNYAGIENLSHIPSSVGAAPIQNIGAYGAEISDCLEKLKAIEINSGDEKFFSNSDCNFGYRTSIFKNRIKNKFIITEVFFRLQKKAKLNISYGTIKTELSKFSEINIQNLRKAIINIRTQKLPNPIELGNAGSFFKNPVVSQSIANNLKTRYPDIPYYTNGNQIKLAAGWLIDQCEWKGKKIKDAGVHKNQALVLINYGQATGLEIVSLSEKIKEDVFKKFGVNLETEVNII